jgi:peroxiredoxin
VVVAQVAVDEEPPRGSHLPPPRPGVVEPPYGILASIEIAAPETEAERQRRARTAQHTQETTRTEPGWPAADGALFTEVLHQAPVHSSVHAFPLENMLHASTLVGRAAPLAVQVGDRAPDFVLVGLDGVTRTLADFRGRPLVLRLSRAVSQLLVCPLCRPGLEELNSIYQDFEASGIQLAVVFSTTPEVTAQIRETCGLSYPLHSDATWDLYRAYGTGHVLLAPRQAWAIVDGDGIVRWLWRMSAATGGHAVPLPSEVLAVARDLLAS